MFAHAKPGMTCFRNGKAKRSPSRPSSITHKSVTAGQEGHLAELSTLVTSCYCWLPDYTHRLVTTAVLLQMLTTLCGLSASYMLQWRSWRSHLPLATSTANNRDRVQLVLARLATPAWRHVPSMLSSLQRVSTSSLRMKPSTTPIGV